MFTFRSRRHRQYFHFIENLLLNVSSNSVPCILSISMTALHFIPESIRDVCRISNEEKKTVSEMHFAFFVWQCSCFHMETSSVFCIAIVFYCLKRNPWLILFEWQPLHGVLVTVCGNSLITSTISPDPDDERERE